MENGKRKSNIERFDHKNQLSQQELDMITSFQITQTNNLTVNTNKKISYGKSNLSKTESLYSNHSFVVFIFGKSS